MKENIDLQEYESWCISNCTDQIKILSPKDWIKLLDKTFKRFIPQNFQVSSSIIIQIMKSKIAKYQSPKEQAKDGGGGVIGGS